MAREASTSAIIEPAKHWRRMKINAANWRAGMPDVGQALGKHNAHGEQANWHRG